MTGDNLPLRNPQKKRPPLMSRFILFSAILFAVILTAGSAAFMFSMRHIIRTNKGNELSQMLEIKRLELETSVNNEISLALMIADSPLIRSFFLDPEDPGLREKAFEELAAYRRAFSANTVFWVNDKDRLFHFNDDEPYVLDAGNPDNYWYNMTLYETEEYNFNINYNPDLNVTNLWINAPVFDDENKPIGIIGTGIDLSTFLSTIYETQYENAEIYFFNRAGEITGAKVVGPVTTKMSINKELGYSGADILGKARSLAPGETLIMDFSLGRMAVSSVPLLEWYSVAVFNYSIEDYNSVMTVFFFLTLIVIVFVFIIFNFFISRLLKPMRKSMEEAESANQAKSDFLSTMSHEIRTPLNAIIGITEIQLQKIELDNDVRDGLEKVFASGEMLLGLINDILDLSKIESGKLELSQDAYDVANMIGDTVQLNIMRIGSKAIEFNLTADEDMPARLIGDELRIKQILNNLLSNAFKYTAEGEVRMSVSAAVAEGADNTAVLTVVVSDSGQGMTKEQVDQLFEAYKRFNLAANRTTEGAGLGMNITRNLISMMNGDIAIESEPGKGSVFTVRLPQGVAGSETLGSESVKNLREFRTSGKSHLKRIQITYDPMPYGSVLVVDDVETNLFVAKGLMSPYGLRIDTAESGYAAIEKIKGGNVYDIIFMDHMMPVMDGIEAAKVLRDLGYDRPIIALTANAVAGQADIFLGNGFDDYISKPIDIRHLNAMLNKLIRDKRRAEVTQPAAAGTQASTSAQSSGTSRIEEIRRRFAEVFLRDANRSIAVLEAFLAKGYPYNEEDIRTFTIHTHGMKSALANMGKTDISAIALKLEMLGRDKNIEALLSETPVFLRSLKAYAEELSPREETPLNGGEDNYKELLAAKLPVIINACREYDGQAAGEALAELMKTAWPHGLREILDRTEERLLHSEFDEIADELTEFLGQ